METAPSAHPSDIVVGAGKVRTWGEAIVSSDGRLTRSPLNAHPLIYRGKRSGPNTAESTKRYYREQTVPSLSTFIHSFVSG